MITRTEVGEQPIIVHVTRYEVARIRWAQALIPLVVISAIVARRSLEAVPLVIAGSLQLVTFVTFISARRGLGWQQLRIARGAASFGADLEIARHRAHCAATGVRFIPVLISDEDVAVQDSQAIMDHLEARYPERGIDSDAPTQQLVSLLFEVYADEWLLLPAMHYRWNIPENRAFAIAEFGRLSAPGATPDEQRAIGEKLSAPFAGALPALGVDSQTAPKVEASYLALLAELEQHFSAHRYLLGARPSRGDVAMFGPLYAHLYRDPASGRLMKEHAPRAPRGSSACAMPTMSTVVGWIAMPSPRRSSPS